ncbi:MAG: TIGR04283 family arsenosugar biosynthesis glycosyltransferase [Pseudomonadota bacterium]
MPALNEEKAIGKVIDAIPDWVDDVILVDNGSTDNTPTIAANHGERVQGGRKDGALTAQAIFGIRHEEVLIVFCRYPEPGKAKTRLIQAFGAQGAAEYHRFLTELTMDKVRDLCSANSGRTVEVHYTGGNTALMKDWLGQDLMYIEQPLGDLGQRMQFAFEHAFEEGARRVVLIGVDVPGISVHLLKEAFFKLRRHDLVLGPCEDGGYYLIGLSRPFAGMFQGISWGTDTVAQDTLTLAQRNSLSYELIKTLKDVDRPSDLIVHKGRSLPSANFSETNATGFSSKSITVIIPTLNEESNLAETLTTVTGFDNVEIIVVDAGSSDKTVDIAREHDATVLSGPTGKSAQMNLGALLANGEIIVFLHADTRLPTGWINNVNCELEQNGVVAGAFKLSIDGESLGLRLIETMANFRSWWLGMPYGDQAIFIKAEVFRSLGGFLNLPIMEDFEFMRRVRKKGSINIVPDAVLTSARRWEKRGIWATTAINQVIIVGYLLGISPKLLARLYGR